MRRGGREGNGREYWEKVKKGTEDGEEKMGRIGKERRLEGKMGRGKRRIDQNKRRV